MPPRLSARKFVLAFLVVIGVTVLVGTKYNLSHLVNKSAQPLVQVFKNELGAQTQRPEEQEEFLDNNIFEEPEKTVKPPERPWFLPDGTIYPTKSKGPPRLFPDQADGDRIYDQLMYMPDDYQGYDSPEKTILLYNGFSGWGQKKGSAAFHECPISRCTLTADRSRASDADAILFKDRVVQPPVDRPMKQVWILYHLECPYHTQSVKIPDSINWTSTYRRDSDIVAPYEYWMYYDPECKALCCYYYFLL
ncbi:glycoprotein 3-alpha-L-fucosyltransferase A-like [Sitophilus oryzae]|uniref:Glycoprotein 3-alpha-L-fucosyltransferase A-like n=1 Tax=Sitophilus oryzae TaxID=7048 RepID=A0A6J2YJK9_SITOR|nr:glycoprotein 3-alpha-L-fucosyltransferase A-like [Sitophilus oryzae]